ncbi:hypothetical protein ACIP5T_03010 [Microbacterium sp. NPDC088619]|uniref:hypothetical protein n=1 Tax=Microbacterium sp. NPDC088619 TaxID=3364196 RepID=UPI00381C3B85
MSTVKELIEQLSKLDPDLHVYYDDASYGMSEIESSEVKEIYAHELDAHEMSRNRYTTNPAPVVAEFAPLP